MSIIPIELRLDDDGLLRKECPYCEQQFKIYPEDEIETNEKYYCPMCGLHAPANEFLTKEQFELASDLTMNFIIDELNKGFGKIKTSFKRAKNVSVDFKPLAKNEPITLIETTEFEDVVFSCCNKHTFIYSPMTFKVLYCHHCGELNFPR